MKKSLLLLIMAVCTTLLSGQVYMEGDRYYGGYQQVLPPYWLSSPQVIIDTQLVIRGDTITGFISDTTGQSALTGKYYLPTLEFVREYTKLPDDSPISSDLTLYIAASGNDVTGDGSAINPYQTVSGALTPIENRKLSGITLTLIFNESGTYQFNESEYSLLSSILYSNCNIQIEGVNSVINSGNVMGEQVPNQMLYNANNVGLTVAENELVGYFVNDGVRDYPISYNSAGTDNYTVEYMRGSRNGTYSIVEPGVILDMSSASNNDFLRWDLTGLPSITFKRIQINYGTKRLDLSRLKTAMIFDFGVKLTCLDIVMGQFSDHTITNINFTGCFLNLTSSGTGFSSRNSMGNYSLTRSVISNTANTSTSVMQMGKSCALELREVAVLGGGSACNAIEVSRFGSVILSKTNVFRNLNSLVTFDYAGGRVLSNSDQGYNYIMYKNVNYTINNIANNTTADLIGVNTDGSFINHLNPANVSTFYSELRGIRLWIDGIDLSGGI